LKKLNWIAPRVLYPHGISGAVGLLTGFALVVGSIIGNFKMLYSHILHVYLGASSINAITGFSMAKLAPTSAQRSMFQWSCIMQLALLWNAWRFRPGRTTMSFEPTMDIVAAFSLMLANLSFVYFTLTWILPQQGMLTCIAVLFGVFAISLMSAYPWHLALGGEAWVGCILESYPKQMVRGRN
jgi:hypothetical protein